MSVEMEITYLGDLKCEATHGPSGRKLCTDAPVDNGGKGEEFSPSDLVATALGSCIVTIMGLVAKRLGIDLAGTRVSVIKKMAAAPARRIGVMEVSIRIPGGVNISEVDRQRLEAAAATCPVKLSLHPDVVVTVDFNYGG